MPVTLKTQKGIFGLAAARVFSKGKAVGRVSVVDVAGRSCASPLPMGNDTYRVKCFVPAGNGG